MSQMTVMDEEALAFLAQVTKALAEQPDSELGLSELMGRVCKYLTAEEMSVFILDESKDELVLTYAAGPTGQEIRGLRVSVGQGVVGWVVKYHESLIVPSTDLDPRFYSGVDEKTGFTTRSILCVPIVQGDRILGALEVLNKTSGYFNADDVVLLEEIAKAVADQIIDIKVALWGEKQQLEYSVDDYRPFLEVYRVKGEVIRPAVLIAPGGGYSFHSEHEGRPIALRFNQVGIHAFVLKYRLKPNPYLGALQDISRAIRLVRRNADLWKVNPNKVAACGFSAGAHLVASLGVHCGTAVTRTRSELDKFSDRPDALILCYPIISNEVYLDFADATLADFIVGGSAARELKDKVSLEKYVTSETPPTFIWHTSDDELASIEHSLIFARALSRHGVPFELIVYPRGGHGLGRFEPHLSFWTNLCFSWIQEEMGWFTSDLDTP